MSRSTTFDMQQWDKFWEYWEDFIEEWPEVKRFALLTMGSSVLKEVQDQVVRQGVNDSRGRIRRWQDMRVGSHNGYVAVSPVSEDVAVIKDGKTTARDITRYVDQGHTIRSPSGTAARYTPRIKSGRTYVPGRRFYSWARMDAQKIALEAADEAVRELCDAIDDAIYGG